jgi:dCMP deaminase
MTDQVKRTLIPNEFMLTDKPPMSLRHLVMFMAQAYTVANRSYAKDLKVGALLVELQPTGVHRVISDGYNGTEVGADNCCEFPDGESKPDVIHAERNLFRKILRSNESGVGCTLFVTRSPCDKCTDLIIDAGIANIVYCEGHRDPEPMRLLMAKKINLFQVNKEVLIDYFDEISQRLRQPKFNEVESSLDDELVEDRRFDTHVIGSVS